MPNDKDAVLEVVEWLEDYCRMAPPGVDARIPQTLRAFLAQACRDAETLFTIEAKFSSTINRANSAIAKADLYRAVAEQLNKGR